MTEITELPLHQQSRGGRMQIVRDAFDGRMRAVGRAERVIDIEIGQRGERGGELAIVLLFLRVEPQVFE